MSNLADRIWKKKLNELCKELYIRTSKLIDDTLRMAKLKTDDIDHVVNNHENPSILMEISSLNYLFRYWPVGQQGFPP